MNHRTSLTVLAVCVLILQGCAVAIPVQEGTSPETLTPGGFRISAGYGVAPLLGLEVTGVQLINQNGASIQFAATELDFGIHDRIDLQFSAGTSGASTYGKYGVKFQWLGAYSFFEAPAGQWASSIAVRGLNASTSSFNSGTDTSPIVYYQNIVATGIEASNSFGYRITHWFGFYTGPKFVNVTLAGQASATTPNNFQGSSRTINGYGGFFALYLSPHNNHIGFELTLEVSDMNFPDTYASNRVWYPAGMLNFAMPFHF